MLIDKRQIIYLKLMINISKINLSSRAPGLTSGLQGSVNVHRGALLLVPQWQCISSFVFYISIFSTHKLPKHNYITKGNLQNADS